MAADEPLENVQHARSVSCLVGDDLGSRRAVVQRQRRRERRAGPVHGPNLIQIPGEVLGQRIGDRRWQRRQAAVRTGAAWAAGGTITIVLVLAGLGAEVDARAGSAHDADDRVRSAGELERQRDGEQTDEASGPSKPSRRGSTRARSAWARGKGSHAADHYGPRDLSGGQGGDPRRARGLT